jgi:hypothetical protein
MIVVKKPAPIPLSMILCDMIIEDKKTSKKSLIGLFSTVTTAKVPCLLNRFGVFISLTEGIGEYACVLRCSFAEDNTQIGETKGQVRFMDRREVVEISLEVNGVSFPRYGDYRFDLYCEEELLISRVINVVAPPSSDDQRKA